jgi:hypothetical protein
MVFCDKSVLVIMQITPLLLTQLTFISCQYQRIKFNLLTHRKYYTQRHRGPISYTPIFTIAHSTLLTIKPEHIPLIWGQVAPPKKAASRCSSLEKSVFSHLSLLLRICSDVCLVAIAARSPALQFNGLNLVPHLFSSQLCWTNSVLLQISVLLLLSPV